MPNPDYGADTERLEIPAIQIARVVAPKQYLSDRL